MYPFNRSAISCPEDEVPTTEGKNTVVFTPLPVVNILISILDDYENDEQDSSDDNCNPNCDSDMLLYQNRNPFMSMSAGVDPGFFKGRVIH